MTHSAVSEIGGRLAEAFRLSAAPLAVCGSEEVPADAVPLPSVHRCIAVAMYRMAMGAADAPALYLDEEANAGCCPGGLAHMGFVGRSDEIRWFVSTGRSDIRGGAAEYLKADPALVDACFERAGPVTPPGRYLVIRPCRTVTDDAAVRSICLFGTAEAVRNIAALVHFDRPDPFSPVLAPWGPACATFVSYPAGLAAGAPRDAAFMGPTDPTVNHALPPDLLAIGIPIAVARRMAGNLDASFVVRRPRVAFPGRGR
ncbi:MAG: DUF169 domain-containing protein [Methanofollis liminatans]|uniref:DUF169 domain-containing protein n=1 Tax=Methanofollis liminatans DSM 4140 TaxID=28892 RepID=J1L1Z9_9EURY|nr:DUF169 domain-containing protein [Methanofollis liminatans]EJG07062.1 hypothetical protein Metli_1105 [Methanofollis liminatans DSM 4140]MDD3111938.1 DUF169 domain-containing protein [Methanofollis liminatans]